MVAKSLGALTLDLVARIGGFVTPMNTASNNVQTNAQKMKASLKNVAVAAAAMGAAGAAAFAAMAKSALNAADDLYKQSQIVGVSVEQLSALKFTAGEAGVEFETLTGALGKFNKNISDAYSKGVGPAADAFADLGISLRNNQGELKSTADLFEEVAGVLSTMRDGATKASIAQDLFGKSGKALIPLLNGGAEGLREGTEAAKRLGQVMGTEAAKAAEQFNDNLSSLQHSITGISNVAALEAAPALARMTEVFADPAVQNGIAAMARGLVDVGSAAVKALSELGNFTTWVAEEAAARFNGVDPNDIVRLEQYLERLEKIRDVDLFSKSTAAFFSLPALLAQDGSIDYFKSLFSDSDEVLKEIEIVKRQVVDAYKGIGAAADAAREQAVMQELDLHGWEEAFENVTGLTTEQIEAARKLREANEASAKAEVSRLSQVRTEYAGVISSLEKQIALYGNKSESVDLAYDLEHGYLKGITGLEKERLIVLQKQLESRKKQTDFVTEQNEIESRYISELNAELEAAGDTTTKFSEDVAERVNEVFADMWSGTLKDTEDFSKAMGNAFKEMAGEIIHQLTTKKLTDSLMNLASGLGGSNGVGGTKSNGSTPVKTGGGGNDAGNMASMAALGPYGIAAAAVIAGASIWNKMQDEKFVKLTSEYKQSNQSIVKVLGEGNKKSESINSAIEKLRGTGGETLGVNYDMLQALLDIRSGIGDVATGFAKTLFGQGDFSNLESSNTFGFTKGAIEKGNYAGKTIGDPLQVLGSLGEAANNFSGELASKISKAIYGKSKKVIDSGINIIGDSLADLMAGGVLEAFSYADQKTTKKFLGVKTSTKVKRQLEDLDDVIEQQITDVFVNVGGALEMATKTFGLNFQDFADQLNIKTQDLSLKGLEGDELTKEIESFFGATLDNWAVVISTGTNLLEQFQEIGESAYETIVRLSSETNVFNDYAEKLNLNFNAAGIAAVEASQNIAELSGGFNVLGASLASYADKFYTDSEKFTRLESSLGEAFAKLGYSLPKTRDAFRSVVEAVDLSTDAGQKQFAALIGLSDVTDRYLSSLKDESALKNDASTREEALRSAVGSAFDSFASAVERDMSLVEAALGASKQVADSLKGALTGMRIESEKNDLIERYAAQAQLFTANAIAKAGGPLPGAGDLDTALSVLVQPSQQLFSSFEDYARDFYVTQKNMKELEAAAGVQVSIDEKNLAALQSSLDYYKRQIELLDGIDSSVLTVRDAVDRLSQALADAGSKTMPVNPVLPALTKDYENNQIMQYTAALNKFTGNGSNLTSETTAKKTTDIAKTVELLVENLQSSQFSIAKNTKNTADMLLRWDIDGLPLEREL